MGSISAVVMMLPKRPVVFCDDKRARAIAEELILSEAELLVLLGDIPLGQFLKKVAAVPYRSLEEYSETYGYGNRTKAVIRGKEIEVLPLAHPRQIGVFGVYNEKWHLAHLEWEKSLEG